jgi:hypothetical protein
LTWKRSRAGIAGYRFVKVLGAVDQGMFYLAHSPDGCQSTVSSSR